MQLDSNMIAAINKQSVIPVWFLWVKARNRNTNAVETVGISNYPNDLTIPVNGQNRTYLGAGGLIDISEINFVTGTDIQSVDVTLAGVDSSAQDLVRAYDSRLSPAELHLGLISIEHGGLVGMASAYEGWLDGTTITGSGSSIDIKITIISKSRVGTKKLTNKKSHEQQLLRDSTDKGREYSTISGSVMVEWDNK